jgi:MFS family permease
MILATSLVALAPSQALVQLLSSQSGGSATTTAVTQTTTILSAISATAAIIEMAASHSLGRMLDRVGRKPTLLAAMGAITISHAIVAITPSYLSNGFEIIAIGIAKLIGILSIGFAVMATQTMFSDLANPSHHHHDLGRKKQHGHNIVSAAIGAQMALSGVGFLVGVMGAGQLTEWGLSCVYGVSAGLGGLAMLLVQRFLPETKINIPTNNNNNNNQSSSPSVWQSLWSCTRLLTRHGKNVRILGILLMLQTLPMFMGDFFLIFAKSEWNLSPQQISSFLALLGVNGVVANVLGGRLLQRLGIRQYTNLAILSKMISAIGASFFGYKGGMWGLAIGCLGSAQSIGIVAALVEQGSASGLPQGELAGERASLMALLKVFGPIWYSALYVQGQRWFGQSNLPFVFNIVLSLTALIISQFYLP